MLNKQECSIPSLLSNGAEVSYNREKATLLNYFFYDCFKNKSPLLDFPPCLLATDCPTDVSCSEAEVDDLIVGLDPSKSTGPDGISAKMLRGTIDAIVPSLTR